MGGIIDVIGPLLFLGVAVVAVAKRCEWFQICGPLLGSGSGAAKTPSTATATGAGGYTAPSGVRDHAQAQAVAESSGVPLDPKEWNNPDMTPGNWKVVQMKQNPGVPNFPGWKVVDAQGRSIAVRFATQAEAVEYIRQHRLAKTKGTFTGPTAGGQTLSLYTYRSYFADPSQIRQFNLIHRIGNV